MAWGRNSVGRRASDRKKPEDVRAEIAVPLSVFIEERLEAGVAGAADGQARAVDQYRKPAVFAVGFDARHAFKIDDVRAVNAHEARSLQAGFQAGDRLLLQVFRAVTRQGHILILGSSAVDLPPVN